LVQKAGAFWFDGIFVLVNIKRKCDEWAGFADGNGFREGRNGSARNLNEPDCLGDIILGRMGGRMSVKYF
jgi:hypothetical protein